MRNILSLAALFFLSSCVTIGQVDSAYDCPKVGLIPQAETVSLPDATARIGIFSYQCSFRQPHPVRTDILLPMILEKKNPAAVIKKISLPYFIAVLGPNDEVLQKDKFLAEFEFDETPQATSVQEHSIYFRVHDVAAAKNNKIVMGFLLDRDQAKAEEEAKQKAATETQALVKEPPAKKKTKKKKSTKK